MTKALEQHLKAVHMDMEIESNTPLGAYFNKASARLMSYLALEQGLCPEYFEKRTVEELLTENHQLFEAVMPENYDHCYANPVYATEIFGSEVGQVVSFLDAQLYKGIDFAFTHKKDDFKDLTDLFLLIYEGLTAEKVEIESLKATIGQHKTNKAENHFGRRFFQRFTYDFQNYSEVILNRDLSDPKYLFEFGVYISKNELRTAEFMNQYNEASLDHLAQSIVKAYVNGFKRDNKDISLRHAVRIVAVAGQERLTNLMMHYLKKENMKPYVSSIETTEYNKQFDFDHKFDEGLYMNEEVSACEIKAYGNAAAKLEKELKDYSGILYVEKFGAEPFSPVNNNARVKLTEAQQKCAQQFDIASSETVEKYLPESERSFCMVAFPTPEIGEQFEEIFADTVKINQMDSDAHEKIQQVIIDTLDQGEFVHVKGYKGNRTDIKVKLHKLNNPQKETNFVNCVADVNIPVGEVFTSPELKGTNGVLHLDTVYLDNFNYENLHLTFENGEITNYNCSNFLEEEKNKEYVRENLLFPHASLPIGEFAIGTNTLAYTISEKYGIVDKLPVLIVEKMGPHFAIGDTCFSWAEDLPVYNPTDGKEITARDNERSVLRKEDVSKAYTGVHTDITIPYDSLEHITVILPTGEQKAIIKEGRFVLSGTEALNEPFEK